MDNPTTNQSKSFTRQDKPKKNKSNKSEPTYKSPTQCICPRCSKTHNRMLYWTGRGTPRMYCADCRHMDELDSPEIIYQVNRCANIERQI